MKRSAWRFVLPALERCQALLLNILGAKSVGVRALVFDEAGRVLLVRHTYREGWFTPGGGVKNGEGPVEALRRELREEVGLELDETPDLFGVYRNVWRGRHDYPILFVVRNSRPGIRRGPDRDRRNRLVFPRGDSPRLLAEDARPAGRIRERAAVAGCLVRRCSR
jgi:8-oxo-dGTP pyrophosphatase MutT (NUDIX family)